MTQSLPLNQLDPSMSKMSTDSIAPTLVVKTPQTSEQSDGTPPAARPRRNAKGKVLRAASSLAPDSQPLDEQSQMSQDKLSQMGMPPSDDIIPLIADVSGCTAKRKKVLRAASDLAPGSCVGTESFKSPHASFDGCSQLEDVCMKEPPVEGATASNGGFEDTNISHLNASSCVGPETDMLRQASQEAKVGRHWVDQAETQGWFGCQDGIPPVCSNQLRSSYTAKTELEASQSQEASQSEAAEPVALVAGIPDAQMHQDSQVPSSENPMGKPEEKEMSQGNLCKVDQASLVNADERSQPLVHRPVQKTHLKYRLVGKQKVHDQHTSTQRLPASCLRSGSNVVRDGIGHSLNPPERGFLVRVQGDGWGGSQGSYLATVTEADAETFTVIRRGDCHGSW
eukprot:CAMPEP_0114695484 /NCGR_PEP_ID=MMETSP0191-20121206/71404_1 /TAXON_ID=126664 /ORGANISM="Sorites sp." /LENGTH=395 /DNA_ID=CAMNT_0001991773 /DNA_START=150 /DNA_END=1335 /DNA_ORIENTATION=+